MLKRVGFAIFAGLMSMPFVFAAAQAPAPAMTAAAWVPFSAEQVEIHRGPKPYADGPAPERCDGQYAQSAAGETYTHGGCSILATIIDRHNRVRWELDLSLKTARRFNIDPRHYAVFAEQPLTPEAFAQTHAEDRALGKKVISGVECEGFEIQPGKAGGQYRRAEVWYAPSLNYVAVKFHFASPDGGDVTVTLDHIETGRPPDPALFQVPPDFRITN
jgi:hypothetical protein